MDQTPAGAPGCVGSCSLVSSGVFRRFSKEQEALELPTAGVAPLAGETIRAVRRPLAGEQLAIRPVALRQAHIACIVRHLAHAAQCIAVEVGGRGALLRNPAQAVEIGVRPIRQHLGHAGCQVEGVMRGHQVHRLRDPVAVAGVAVGGRANPIAHGRYRCNDDQPIGGIVSIRSRPSQIMNRPHFDIIRRFLQLTRSARKPSSLGL
jgi:hypothetical protein